MAELTGSIAITDNGAEDDLNLSLPSQLDSSDLNFSQSLKKDRSSSESDLAKNCPSNNRSSLTVDKNDFTLGLDSKVKVTWDIKEDVGASDWIGLFPSGNSFFLFLNGVLNNSISHQLSQPKKNIICQFTH